MPISLRRLIYTLCTLLWLSGCVWLIVHFFFPVTTQFGPAPNPLEPWLLRVHGWRDVPSDTLDAPRRLDFSREAEIASVSNSCVGNEIRQPLGTRINHIAAT